MALRGYNALVKAQSSAVVFTDEATTTADNQTYTITDSNKTIWDLNTAIVVEDGGVPTTETYTLSRLTGTVTFGTVDAGRTITVTGAYVSPVTIAKAKMFSFSGTADALDSTVFQKTFREYESGNKTATVTIGTFYDVDSFFLPDLLSGEYKVIELYPDAGDDPVRVYGVPTGDTIDSPVDGLIEESITYQVTTEITN